MVSEYKTWITFEFQGETYAVFYGSFSGLATIYRVLSDDWAEIESAPLEFVTQVNHYPQDTPSIMAARACFTVETGGK